LTPDRNEWPWVMRTYLFDTFIAGQVAQGVDLIVNLAAGLDARPYRMTLPPSLLWVEVDMPELLAYKEEALRGEKPVCKLERIGLDLADVGARRDLLQSLSSKATKAMAVSEGLIIYLEREEVGELASDLAAPPSFRWWALDLASPGLLKMIQKQIGAHLSQARAPLKFAPEEGPGFFEPFGWHAVEVRSMFKEAARHKRLAAWMRLLALLPESNGRQGSRPWSAVCLMERSA
jgi:methyltransferase (TIGR00027 family)